LIEQLEELYHWHHKWSQHLVEFAWKIGLEKIETPAITFYTRPLRRGRTAGYYTKHKHACAYSLAYHILVKQEYEVTVAHECCHAFQHQFVKRSKWHGDLFHFLLQRVCGFPNHGATHHHDHVKARKISQLLELKRSTIQEKINVVKSKMQELHVGQRGIYLCPPEARRNLAACDT
jgi:predicted SprT family Zn-dependent metalloprotease